jgi:hypothetical protein
MGELPVRCPSFLPAVNPSVETARKRDNCCQRRIRWGLSYLSPYLYRYL